MSLRAYTDADLELALALETDPVAMRELGGPREESAIRDVHVRRLAARWWLVITDEDGAGVGTIGAWESEHDGQAIHETGWMVLPAAQGRGYASAGLRLLLDRIRASGDVSTLHAFPGATNVASNRLCESAGFELLGEADVEFAGHVLPCRHWVLAV